MKRLNRDMIKCNDYLFFLSKSFAGNELEWIKRAAEDKDMK